MNNSTISETVYDSVFGSVRKTTWLPIRILMRRSLMDLTSCWTWGRSAKKTDSIIDFLDIAAADYFKQK